MPGSSNTKYIYSLTCAYFLLGLAGILNHEAWLDEAHHFLIAKDSTSIPDLIYNARYEGHPLLWSFLVYMITRFTTDIFYMQLFNCLVMTLTCFLFLKHSRRNTLFNVLILGGYFFIYEYLVISRSYSLLLFALCWTCISLKEPGRAWQFYTALTVLALTHVFGIIISLVISGLLLSGTLKKTGIKKPLVMVIIVINLFVLWSIRIPADHFLFHYDTDGFYSYKRAAKTAGIFAKGFLPLPDITENIKWNSNFFTNQLRLAGVVTGILVFMAPLYFFRKHKALFLLYLITSVLIAIFMHISPVVISVRYCGILFVLFIYIFCFLLPVHENNRQLKVFTAGICVLQLISGIIMYAADFRRDFSNAKNVALFIKSNNLQNKPLIVSNFSAAPAISCYLGQKIYYAETGEYGSYCKWNAWPFILDNKELTIQIARLCRAKDTLILVLNDHYLHTDLHDTLMFNDPKIHYSPVKKFDKAIVNNENYTVFYIVPD